MNEPNDTKKLFTGRKRARSPKKSVRVADRAARVLISLGGVGSIVAVSLVGAFLIWVVIPLFLPPAMPESGDFTLEEASRFGRAVHLGVNEYHTMSWSFLDDGWVEVRRLADGALLERRHIPGDQTVTAWSFSIQEEQCAFGFADGTVRLGRIGFLTAFLEPDELPAELRDLPVGGEAVLHEGVVQRTPEGQFRHQKLLFELEDSILLGDRPIVLVDQTVQASGAMFAALDITGVLHTSAISRRTNLLTGEVTARVSSGRMVLDLPATGPAPIHLLLTGLGDNIFLAWGDGRLLRFDTRHVGQPFLVESLDLVPEPDASLTSLGFQNGRASLLSGDSLGRLTVWYRIRFDESFTSDGTVLVAANELSDDDSAVTALAASPRSRMVAAGYADGSVRLYHVTSGRRLAEARVPAAVGAVTQLMISPRDDALLATAGRRLTHWSIDVPHPEITFRSLLLPVWYEGYPEPDLVWQSSSGTDDFEPKYSLTPLIFGTLKATFYSMLFGLPLALLAAVYTSEFLHPRHKTRVKPVIEMMASLPSVVLGFLAALVFAPFIEKIIPHTLAAFVTVPVALLLGAHLWQLLRRQMSARLGKYKLVLMSLMLPVGVWSARELGRPLEEALFAGDIMAWLDGQVGNGMGGWLFILLPLSGLAAAFLQSRTLNPWLRHISHDWSRERVAWADLAKFLVSLACALGLALLGAWIFNAIGWDPRGSYVDTYVQRNALVVGFVMGFAIIPIIYTIAEDALSAVPEHLRAASLGAGATPWQTAVRVIIPLAMSGLFSAIMIGLGRAVGETMIVLMAAGNTPIMGWNVFDGFRTLSANIAVEIPEAVQNSTHFRTLFLAALTLFLITFVLNTVAETVRIRFRKKAFEL